MTLKRIREERNRSYPGCWYYETADNDQIYYCQYKIDGKQITAKVGSKKHDNMTLSKCNRMRSAYVEGKEKNRQQRRRERQEEKARYIDSLYRIYLNNKNGKGIDYSRFNNWVLPYWRNKDISQCTNRHVANYRTWLESQTNTRGGNLSPQSVKHCLALFRRIVRHGKKHISGFELKIDDFDIPAVHNEKTEDLTHEQFHRLLHILHTDKINRPVCDILLLMLNTGMRRGEVLKLQWQHVKFDRRTILLKSPKGGKDVEIPMNASANKILERQKKTSMYVFPGLNGGKRLHIDKQARRIRNLAGLPNSFRPCHGLRHYYGTELGAKGYSISVISELLGHKSIEITKRYVNAREEQKRQAVDSISTGV